MSARAPGTARRTRTRIRTWTALAVVGAGAAAVGSAGPWVTLLGAGISGLEGDGLITLVLALVAAGAMLRRLAPVLQAICGLGILAVAALDLRDISRLPAGEPGWGLLATVAGGAALLAAGALATVGARRARGA